MQSLTWAGHIDRLPDNDHTKRLTMSYLEGERCRGRPRRRWLDDVEEDQLYESEDRRKSQKADASGDGFASRARSTNDCRANYDDGGSLLESSEFEI